MEAGLHALRCNKQHWKMTNRMGSVSCQSQSFKLTPVHPKPLAPSITNSFETVRYPAQCFKPWPSDPQPLALRASCVGANGLSPKGKDYGQPLFGEAKKPEFLGIELQKIIPIGLIFSCLFLKYTILVNVSAMTARGRSAEITAVLSTWFSSHSMAEPRGRAIISALLWEIAYQITNVYEAERFNPLYQHGASAALILPGRTANYFPNLRKYLGPEVDGWAMMSIMVLMGPAICFYYWWVYKFVFLPTQIYKKKENPKMGTVESLKCFVSSRNIWDYALVVVVCSLTINLPGIAKLKTQSLIPLKVRLLARLVTGLLTQPQASIITLLYYSGLLPRNVELDRFIHHELAGRENYLYHSLLHLLRCFWQ